MVDTRILVSCPYDASGRERECSRGVKKWSHEAFSILQRATDPTAMFMIDLKNICDTGKQCGCFLRGSPTRYKPTCSNRLISVDSVSLIILVNSRIVHEHYGPREGFPNEDKYVKIATVFISKEDRTKYKVSSLVDPEVVYDDMAEADAMRVFEILIERFDAVLEYVFDVTVEIPNPSAYIETMLGMVGPLGDPLIDRSSIEASRYDFRLNMHDLNPVTEMHVTLDDSIVWHVVDFCRLRVTTDLPSKIEIGVMSSNVPPFVL